MCAHDGTADGEAETGADDRAFLVSALELLEQQPRIARRQSWTFVLDYDAHHLTEAQYKAVARALRQAVEYDPRVTGVPSTNGTL